MHRQVSQPRQEPTEEPSEPVCEESPICDGLPVKLAAKVPDVKDTGNLGAINVNQSTAAPQSHSTETADVYDDEEGTPLLNKSGSLDELESEEKLSSNSSDSEPPSACRKAIKNMGLEKGTLRSMIITNLVPRCPNAENAKTVMPDDAETCHSPEEEIMVACTPAMIDLLADPDQSAEEMETQGAPLTKILKKMKTDDPALAVKLGAELAHTKIQARRRKPASGKNNSMTIKQIRRNYAERQYQRLIEGDVGGCVNALRLRTTDRFRDQRLIEMKLSYSAGFSALVVFAASFLVGYYFAMYVLGIKSAGTQILFGSVTAVLGGILEAVLLMIGYGRLDAEQAAIKVK